MGGLPKPPGCRPPRCRPLLWAEGMTHACENITLPQTFLLVLTIYVFWRLIVTDKFSLTFQKNPCYSYVCVLGRKKTRCYSWNIWNTCIWVILHKLFSFCRTCFERHPKTCGRSTVKGSFQQTWNTWFLNFCRHPRCRNKIWCHSKQVLFQ